MLRLKQNLRSSNSLTGLVSTCSSSLPLPSFSTASLKCFHCSSWTSIVWHFKNVFKAKFFTRFTFKMKSDFKVRIKAKHKQQLNMICFNVDLKSGFYFEFGNTQRTHYWGLWRTKKQEALEDEAKGHYDDQVITRPGEEYEPLMFCFNITNNMDNLDLILHYSSYSNYSAGSVISFSTLQSSTWSSKASLKCFHWLPGISLRCYHKKLST